MLAELFMMRMEAIARSIDLRGANNSDNRFAPDRPLAPARAQSPFAHPSSQVVCSVAPLGRSPF